MGLGHLQRNLAVARALLRTDPRASVLLATSVEDVAALGVPEGAEVLRLPALRKVANEQYESRRLKISSRELTALRSQLLRAAVEAYRPDVLLVDKHPLGARGELVPAFDALRAANGRAVLGLRDILDAAPVVRSEWARSSAIDAIAANYDRVLVYGQQDIYDAVAEYDLPDDIASRTMYCGYVFSSPVGCSVPQFPRPDGRPLVLATAGGGEDGFELLQRFLATAENAEWDALVVTGPFVPEPQLGSLRGLADRVGAQFHRVVHDLSCWFPAVDALVCMGGYNTLSAALATSTPTVAVPRVLPRAEQLLRAEAFAALGLLQCIAPAELDQATLRRAIEAALATRRSTVAARVSGTLRFGGAERAAAVLTAVSQRPSPARIAPAATRGGWSDGRVLVTGAAGFVGSHVVDRLLARGAKVRGVDCFTPYYEASHKRRNLEQSAHEAGFELIEADLRVADIQPLLDGIDVVIHLAGQPGVRSSWGDGFREYVEHNVLATQRLLEAALETGITRFVNASSSSVYGNARRYPTSEGDLPRPVSPYGVTKLAAEHLISLFGARGLPAVSLRYFTVYGPRQRPDMALHQFLRGASCDEPIPVFGDGQQRRQFTFVADVVDATLRAATTPDAVGQVLNIAGGSEATVNELIATVARVLGRDVRTRHLPAQAGDVARTGGDGTLAGEVLGWRPKVGLIEGVAAQLEWFLGSSTSPIQAGVRPPVATPQAVRT